MFPRSILTEGRLGAQRIVFNHNRGFHGRYVRLVAAVHHSPRRQQERSNYERSCQQLSTSQDSFIPTCTFNCHTGPGGVFFRSLALNLSPSLPYPSLEHGRASPLGKKGVGTDGKAAPDGF